MILRTLLLFCILLLSDLLTAQKYTTFDGLFNAARNSSFRVINDGNAKEQAKDALLQSYEYTDMEGFSESMFLWNKEYHRELYNFQNSDLEDNSATATEHRSSLPGATSIHSIGVVSNYRNFYNKINQRETLPTLTHTMQTSIASVTARKSLANSSGAKGQRKEAAYRRISRIFQNYIQAGFLGRGVFPKYRAGFSLYANLPHTLEAEGGLRYLNFGNSTYVYTGYLAKYVNNCLLGVRAFVTPGNNGNSQSYSFVGRYYFNRSNDYLGLTIGSGMSPDDRTLNIQFIDKNRLSSRKASANFSHRFSKNNIFSMGASFVNPERKISLSGNQYDVSVGLQRRF